MRSFPVPRQIKAHHVMVWVYVDEGAQRRFLDDSRSGQDKELRAGKTIKTTGVMNDQIDISVRYSETRFQRKP
jgi:hypothetical protein